MDTGKIAKSVREYAVIGAVSLVATGGMFILAGEWRGVLMVGAGVAVPALRYWREWQRAHPRPAMPPPLPYSPPVQAAPQQVPVRVVVNNRGMGCAGVLAVLIGLGLLAAGVLTISGSFGFSLLAGGDSGGPGMMIGIGLCGAGLLLILAGASG